MPKSRVITVPNPALKEKTENISSLDEPIKRQTKEMVETLRAEGGIGLAANQLGYKNKLVVIEFNDPENTSHIPLTIFINPEIVEYSKELECFDEGCLSVPKIEFEIERPTHIKLKYKDEHGHKLKIAPKGLLARILQHEVDHLDGILFTEIAKTQLFKKHPELKNIKIAFFGTGPFAAIILEGLIHMGLNLDIYTENNSPAAKTAQRFKKEFFDAETTNTIERDFDLLICADYGHKISSKVLKKAKIDAINLHGSLLPKYPGPSPIQSAILSGEKTTGVTIIRMSDEIDKGPILAQIETEIEKTDNYPALRDKLATLGLKLLVKVLPEIINHEIKAVPQAEGQIASTHKFKKEDGQINWDKSPEEIDRQIRAFHPWPGSFTFIDNKRLIIHIAHLKENKLVLDLIQLEGKKPMSFSDFLRGWQGEKPDWFAKIAVSD